MDQSIPSSLSLVRSLRFRGLTPRQRFGGDRAAQPRVGDIVRFEFSEDGLWFYCRVERLLAQREVQCVVVEAQSWPELGAAGILPGRPYVAPMDCVLSIVRRELSADARESSIGSM